MAPRRKDTQTCHVPQPEPGVTYTYRKGDLPDYPPECGKPCLPHRVTCSEECRQKAASMTQFDMRRDHGQKQWTEERIIQAFQKYNRARGRPPRASDWLKAELPKTIDRDWFLQREFPNVATVQRVFGSWNKGLEAAGFKPRLSGGAYSRNQRTCRSGRHPWTPENIYTWPGGARTCRTCLRESQERYQRRRGVHPRLADRCRRGHFWTPESEYISPTGKRYCRICRSERDATP